jgi:hypothetical protein
MYFQGIEVLQKKNRNKIEKSKNCVNCKEIKPEQQQQKQKPSKDINFILTHICGI